MKRANIVLLTFATIVICGFAYIVYSQARDKSQEALLPGNATEITPDQVAKHSSLESCWIIIGQKVYNLTPYLSMHPDDTTYKEVCGTDATTKLAGNIPSKQSLELQKFISAYYIGILVP